MFATEAEALTFARGVYPITGSALAVVRWKSSPKKPHEYGTQSKGTR